MFAVAHVLGLTLAFFGITFLMPIVCSVLMQDRMFGNFAVAAGVVVVLGLALAGITHRYRRELKPRDGFLLVTLSWVLMSGAAAVPMMLALPGLSFTDAYFEAMSGLTTTGSTILVNLDSLPPSINLWRHALHWFGGIGIIVLAISILPLLGVGGMQLYRAEAPGAVKDSKLTPRITQTAKALWFTYSGITAVGIVALKACGMSWLDAICHAFSAMALGGFSTHDRSVAWFDSPAVEAVLIVLMVVSSLNFARHYLALRTQSLEPYRNDPECRAILLVLATSVLGIAIYLDASGTYPEFPVALRHAAFNVVAAATTAGFASVDYDKWPIFAPVWMLFLSGVVCSTGSTGGGVKMFRTLLLLRQAAREMKLLVHPSAVIPMRIGSTVIPNRISHSVLAFIFLYFQTIVALTFVLLLSGMDFVPALSSIVASINNLGPGIGPTGPAGNYHGLTDLQTWVCTLAMLLGRLEIFSVLVLFTPTFWRK
jgi:trk system potassium uptake protein TrkH